MQVSCQLQVQVNIEKLIVSYITENIDKTPKLHNFHAVADWSASILVPINYLLVSFQFIYFRILLCPPLESPLNIFIFSKTAPAAHYI